MNNNTHIILLVKKLLNDDISPEELNELLRSFSKNEASGEISRWLDESWETVRSDDFDHAEVDFTVIKNRLEKKIQQSGKKNFDLGKVQSPKMFLTSLMRYAAVFLLAVGLSWIFFHDNKSAEENQNPVIATNHTGKNEISVTYGSRTRIVLPDGSIAHLNSGSKLEYPSVFSDQRHVTLEGEGYFIVQADSLSPFLVHASDISVKALGTEFNVKAYPEENQVTTVLVQGTVEIFRKNQINPIVGLIPGESATYVKAEEQPVQDNQPFVKKQPQMIVKTEPKIDLSVCWVQNQLAFDAESFDQIAVRLERWFDIRIDIKNPKLSNKKLSGRYDTETIEQVLHSMQLTTPFRYKMDKNKIVIE